MDIFCGKKGELTQASISKFIVLEIKSLIEWKTGKRPQKTNQS